MDISQIECLNDAFFLRRRSDFLNYLGVVIKSLQLSKLFLPRLLEGNRLARHIVKDGELEDLTVCPLIGHLWTLGE